MLPESVKRRMDGQPTRDSNVIEALEERDHCILEAHSEVANFGGLSTSSEIIGTFGKNDQITMMKFNVRREDIKDHYHRILLTLEDVGHVYDYMVKNPGKDMLLQLRDATQPEEQLFSIRPLAAWIADTIETDSGPTMRVPLVAVEWFHGRKANSSKDSQTYAAGFRQGTMFQEVGDCRVEDIELFKELLQSNRQKLANGDPQVKMLEKHCTDKGWHFSVVLRAADPTKRGGARECEVCNGKADFTCIRCGNVAYYCGRECQRKHWKIHKKACKSK
jgi:hypothetical protein